MSTARLVLCAGGIYASFLTWALVQERLTSTPYYADPAHIRAGDAKPRFFRHVIFLNTVQSTCSALAALCYIAYKSRIQHTSWSSRLGLSVSVPKQVHPVAHTDTLTVRRPVPLPQRPSKAPTTPPPNRFSSNASNVRSWPASDRHLATLHCDISTTPHRS